MYRNKPAKGFQSPLVALPSKNVEEAENVSTNQQEVSNDSTKKPFRSTLQILNIFERAIRENDDDYDNVKVKNTAIKKPDVKNPIDEKKTSTVVSGSKV